MYEKDSPATCKGEARQTEAQRILDKFDYKLDAIDLNTKTIIDKITTLGGFELLKSEASDSGKPSQQSNCFINELDLRLERLQRLLEAYDAIRYNLERLV
jgi:hypothetical protein